MDNFYGWASNNEQATQRTIRTLREFWNVEEVGVWSGMRLFKLPQCTRWVKGKWKWISYEIWYICDNGGELNVGPVNHNERMVSIPYASTQAELTAETMAERIWRAMTGREIDYIFNDIPAIPPDEPLPIIIEE